MKPTKAQVEEMCLSGGGPCGHPKIDMARDEPQSCPNCQAVV
ncbi:hypothetical protein LCGC14_1256470 [marine sediment metagenome]|uniref:Uncharacterized protein n=1 Tax=marine sediment metagenome TaxID=412755 RepID=A0A0F9LN89_9ZZZZ